MDKTSKPKQSQAVSLLTALDKQAGYFKEMTLLTADALKDLTAMPASHPNFEDEIENIFADIRDLFNHSKEMHDLLLEIKHSAQRELQTEEDAK